MSKTACMRVRRSIETFARQGRDCECDCEGRPTTHPAISDRSIETFTSRRRRPSTTRSSHRTAGRGGVIVHDPVPEICATHSGMWGIGSYPDRSSPENRPGGVLRRS